MSYVSEVLEELKRKNPAQDEFVQAAHEVLESLDAVIESDPDTRAACRARPSDYVPRALD